MIMARVGCAPNRIFAIGAPFARLFCDPQKSLANGAPMAKILFGSHPALAMIMLPLLMYHQLQLVVCFALARRYAARAVSAPAEKDACS